jgi:nitrogen regulatory protein P-II 1
MPAVTDPARRGAGGMLSRWVGLMKKLEAIIRKHKFEVVRNALTNEDIVGITVSEVRGLGRQRGVSEQYRGAEYKAEFQPKLKLEVVVNDTDVNKVLTLISTAARTGEVGDGKIFITSLANVIRIRTGESGPAAI